MSVSETDKMVSDNMNHTTYHRMVCDAAGPEFNPDEEPNAEARNFYDMIRAGDKPVYEGNSKHTQLSATVRMLEIKCMSRPESRSDPIGGSEPVSGTRDSGLGLFT